MLNHEQYPIPMLVPSPTTIKEKDGEILSEYTDIKSNACIQITQETMVSIIKSRDLLIKSLCAQRKLVTLIACAPASL